MYYASNDGSRVTVYEASTGAVYFPIPLFEKLDSYNLSGNVLCLTFVSGKVEVYDVPNRVRIR